MPSRHDPVTEVRGGPKSEGRRGAKLPVFTTEKEKRKSKLSLAVAAAEPDGRKSSGKARVAVSCKKRPDSKRAARGSGGSKRFVPWC